MSSCRRVDIRTYALKTGTQCLSLSGWRSETKVIVSYSLLE